MNCPKCNFSIPEGDAFCPNCGTSVNAPVSEPIISTPVDGLNLRGCATVAPETPVYAAPVNKPSKGLAIAAYILYAIAILVFAFFILVMGFGLDFSRSSGSLNLPAGDIAVTVKPGSSITIPAGHPVYTEMNAVTAEELMAIYEKYDAFGVCPGRETMLSESETSRFLGDVGGNPDDYMHYSVFRMNDCKSIKDIKSHMSLYLTDDLIASVTIPERFGEHDIVFLNELNGSVYHGSINAGLGTYIPDTSTLQKKGDKWVMAMEYAEEGDFYPGGVVTFVEENGMFKVAEFDTNATLDSVVDTPVQTPTDVPYGHKVYTEMNSSSVQTLIDNYWCYHYCGECRGEKEYIDFEAAVSVFEAAGLDGNISQAYTLNRLKCCNTLREMDQHALLYMTPEVAKDAYTRTPTSSGFEDAFTFEADGKAYVAWGNMGHDGIYVEDGTLKQENGKWTVKTCYYSPGEDVPDPAYKFTFNNDAGYYRIDSVTPLF